MATCLMTVKVCCSSSEFAKTEAGEGEPPAAIELEQTVEQPALCLLCQRDGTHRRTSVSTDTTWYQSCSGLWYSL